MNNQTNTTNVHVNFAPPMAIQHQPGCLTQFVYFLFIGWWLGGISIIVAYCLLVTVLGIPLGIMILNRLPYLFALRQKESPMAYYGVKAVQHNVGIRALWFCLVGFWATLIWLIVGYVLACTIIGLPVAFWMFDRAPTILTLQR